MDCDELDEWISQHARKDAVRIVFTQTGITTCGTVPFKLQVRWKLVKWSILEELLNINNNQVTMTEQETRNYCRCHLLGALAYPVCRHSDAIGLQYHFAPISQSYKVLSVNPKPWSFKVVLRVNEVKSIRLRSVISEKLVCDSAVLPRWGIPISTFEVEDTDCSGTQCLNFQVLMETHPWPFALCFWFCFRRSSNSPRACAQVGAWIWYTFCCGLVLSLHNSRLICGSMSWERVQPLPYILLVPMVDEIFGCFAGLPRRLNNSQSILNFNNSEVVNQRSSHTDRTLRIEGIFPGRLVYS